MEDKKVLLSLKNVWVKFKVRGRILTAIRGISLDIYENESIAIVGESGSGKSVLTKTFAGMLDSNGYVSDGEIILKDKELADTDALLNRRSRKIIDVIYNKLNKFSKLEFGSETFKEILNLSSEKKSLMGLTDNEEKEIGDLINDYNYDLVEASNLKQTLDTKKEHEKILELNQKIKDLKKKIEKLNQRKLELIKKHKEELKNNSKYLNEYEAKMALLNKKYREEIEEEITDDVKIRNLRIAKEVYLSVGRYSHHQQFVYIVKLLSSLKKAMRIGVDLNDSNALNKVFDTVVFRVEYISETEEKIHGVCNLDLAKIKYTKDWQQIRGSRVATVFQDPMTSLNPIITIGKQITSVIMKHQKCSIAEAKIRAIELMERVGIKDAANRFDDYPFQYSGGMRQRIVIAIALSCQPKILICDEPTTALDVTIQAQILKLIKDLQKEFGFTIIFITHDLGVVANIADRVAVLYAGQIVELGTCKDVFYDPRHPYTWALLSSLPQLAVKGEKLYSISGTPPSLYNQVIGDPFAPRNPYCLKIDTIKDSPMFKISETHYAKTWLCDPRAPKLEKPEIIQNIHEKLLKAFNI